MAEQHITGEALLSSHLVVPSVERALRFYREAFGAVEEYFVASPDGTGLEAGAWLNGALLLLTAGDVGVAASPGQEPRCAWSLHLALDNVEQAFYRAVEAGARPLHHPGEAGNGRRGSLKDPFGYEWCLREPSGIATGSA